jgi:glycosyltransferase involved in cell wall biosynthesis
MNKGIRMASGEVIGIVHSDDYYEPGAVRAVAEAFTMHPEIDVLYGDMRYHKEDGAVICKPLKNIKKAFSQGLPISHPTIFVSKRAYENYGLYDVNCKYAMDNELFSRYLHAGARFHYLRRIITNMRTGGVSDTIFTPMLREVRDVAIKYGSSKIKAYAYFYFRIFFKVMEKRVGILLRKLGLHCIIGLYRKVFYPHVSEDLKKR